MSPMTLVVGTTPDYIDWLRQARPGRCLFLTAPAVRLNALESRPGPGEELLVPLDDVDEVRRALDLHLQRREQKLDGVVCFDCERLSLAAELALVYGLAFHSPETVNKCRDKGISKQLWRDRGLACPEGKVVETLCEAREWMRRIGGPMVLKPTSGTGSELTFVCDDEEACGQRFEQIQKGLQTRVTDPLYRDFLVGDGALLAEAHITGTEYSADFHVAGDALSLIRLTEKIPRRSEAFGETLGYVTVDLDRLPFDLDRLCETLMRAASALGITSGISMVDFIYAGELFYLLEMTPRPGGDCLPWLLKDGLKVDVLSLAVDLASGHGDVPSLFEGPVRFAGLRLRADRSGRLVDIDDSKLAGNSRIISTLWKRKPGDQVILPPQDRDSAWLGHIIVGPLNGDDAESLCRSILGMVNVEIGE